MKLLKSTFGGVHNTALQAWHSSKDNISITELLAINIVHSIQTRLENTLQWVHAFFFLTVNGDLLETSSSCRKDLVGECTGEGEMHT